MSPSHNVGCSNTPVFQWYALRIYYHKTGIAKHLLQNGKKNDVGLPRTEKKRNGSNGDIFGTHSLTETIITDTCVTAIPI